MITPEEIVEVLSECPKENGISEIKIRAVGDIVSRLENRIDPEHPYHLTVRPLEEAQTLCIDVFPLLNIRKDSDIYRKLILLNLGLGCGCLCSNPSNGRLHFKIEHFCEDDEGPSQEFFVRLCFECLRDVRVIEQFLLFENMVDSGLTQESAEQFVKKLFRDTSGFRFIDWDQTIMQEPSCKKTIKE